MRELGKKTMYAPRTPAIAPLAPTIGVRDSGLLIACTAPAAMPQRK